MSDNQAIEPATDPSSIFYPDPEAEPLKPTAEDQDEDPSEDELNDDAEVEGDKPDDAAETDDEPDAEESGDDDEQEGDDEEETLYLELDGEDYPLDEVRAWKAGHLMQADYTKKTQAHAENVKAFDTEKQAFAETKTNVEALSMELAAMVAEDEAIDWAELKEDDPEEYINKKEKADARKAKVAELKNALPAQGVALTNDQLVAEQKDLFAANPAWLKDGKRTDAYEADIKRAYEYAGKIGYSQDELNSLCHSHHWKTLLDASKNAEAPGKKKSALEKKVKRAPLVTKPKKSQAKKAKSTEDVFYGT